MASGKLLGFSTQYPVPSKRPSNSRVLGTRYWQLTMLKVGLTGGIASGKSVVGEMFVALGAHLVQADRISHQLMEPGEAVYNEVVRHFGAGILNPDLSVNRARLAEAAFNPAASRVEELNHIVHPAVIRAQEEWMEEMGRQDPRAVAIVEAALILEAGRSETI